MPALLRRTLHSTNVMESLFSKVRGCERNIKRCRNTQMAQRWLATIALYAEENCNCRFSLERVYFASEEVIVSVSELVCVVADHRESAAPIVGILRAFPNVRVELQSLKTGDYRVEHWVFERKTLVDFVESIIEGRLFSQAQRLTTSAEPGTIILEGKAASLADSQMRREAIQGAMIALSLVFEIPVLRSRDPLETARLLIYAGQQLGRQDHDQMIRTRPFTKEKPSFAHVSHVSTNTATIRKLRTDFRSVKRRIEQHGEGVITDHGEPAYVIKPLPRRPDTRASAPDYSPGC